jgi:4-amino-4-deoxy-L-arabinose transferase-like glycosyltransferase
MIHALTQYGQGRPPLIAWAGQFFLPLRHLTGGFESAMLVLNIVAASGTLALVYVTTRRLGASVLAGLVAIAVCGSSQLFIALTHQYLVEMLQCFAAACMIFVAWRAEKRSVGRVLSLTLAAVALSFLSKASSAPFVLPVLAYIAVALFVTQRRPKPQTSASDLILLIAAVALTGGTCAWYFINLEPTVRHFIEATSGDVALNYGSAVHIATKLKYWTTTLGLALSPFFLVSICIAGAIVLAIAKAMIPLRKIPFGDWAVFSVESGLLFALALAGTVCLTLLGYSLQINESSNYILPVIPMVAVLLGWSLSLLQSRALSAVFLLALGCDAALAHGYSFGTDPLRITPTPWLWQIQVDTSDKSLLTAAVDSTCQAGIANIVGVDYIRFNAVSANFYAEKKSYTTGYRCYYGNLGYLEKDIQHALEKITATLPPYILTVAPEKQLLPPDFLNVVSKPVAEFVARDPHYALTPNSGEYLLIYERRSGHQ